MGGDSPRIVTMLGAKGGVGTSVLAVGLAGELAPTCSPCLVDLDLYKGDLAGLLDLPATRPLSVVAEMLPQLDALGLKGCADQHPSGIAVIGQAFALEDAAAPSRSEVARILRLCAEAYDKVIVDGGSRIDPQTIRAAQESDVVVVVTTPEILALRDVNRLLLLLEHFHVPRRKIRLVLNRVDRHSELDPEAAAEAASMAIAAVVHEDAPTARHAARDARPVPTVAPASRLGVDLVDLWEALSGEQLPRPEVAPWWRRILGRQAVALPT